LSVRCWDNDRDSQAGGARGNSTGGLEKTMTDLGDDGDDRAVDRPDGKVKKTAEDRLRENLARRGREARERDSRWLEEGREGYNLRSRAPPK